MVYLELVVALVGSPRPLEFMVYLECSEIELGVVPSWMRTGASRADILLGGALGALGVV